MCHKQQLKKLLMIYLMLVNVKQITRQTVENILKEHNCTSEELTAALTEALQSANPLSLLSREGSLAQNLKGRNFIDITLL